MIGWAERANDPRSPLRVSSFKEVQLTPDCVEVPTDLERLLLQEER